ncbi:hypothetical protein BOTBODRAFT_103494 [Botryobasidium botryosum FD-172 SS1]|uniref:Protein kinase domain-containing protein n=1 Tax=Botryobasidium botryosum (strain FD-172 SS1) TaxID=930990 RepID=A0A067N4M1_BOTB1|nr:hypothetical protein BOTBODRAFT_103494 [Botryobasidium botryosum FD-172 SS1]
MSLLLPAHLHSPSLPEIAILQRTDVINPTTHFTTADVSILHEGKHHTTFHATLSRKGHKGEGKEFGVTDGVRWWDPYCRPREVVYKVATTPRAIELLKHEANVYRQLRKLQGKCVPLFHGLFEGFMQGEAAACIVIDYCGVPLKVTLDRVNRDDLKKVVDAVVAIHKAGVIHNDLYERNIVFLDGRPFIINFELAIPHKCSAPRIFIGGPQPNDYDFGCDELYILCSDEMANLWSPGNASPSYLRI